MSVIEIIKDIVLPIVLMLLGWLYGKYTKINAAKDEMIRNLQDQVDHMEDSNLDDRLDKVESSIEELKTRQADNTDSISQSVNGLIEAISELKEDQDHISRASQLNGRYTHELALLMMTLSEGIRDQHLDGNITRAITRYRKFEQDVLGDVIGGNNDA